MLIREIALTVALLAPASLAGWIDDPAMQQLAAGKTPQTPMKFQLDLDLPQKQRWTHIMQDPRLANAAKDVHSYFLKVVPKHLLPFIENVAKDLAGHFHDYADEIKGIAEALNMSVADVALVNLAYPLQEIGNVNCSQNNVTGPCPPKETGPGLCTSYMAEDSNGTMWHARNLDWDLPDFLRKYIFDVEFMRGGKLLYTASTIAGLTGLLHGMKKGAFSISLNSREHSGSPILNLLDWLILPKQRLPTHLVREVFEGNPDYESTVQHLSTVDICAPVYFIVAGASRGQGCIISRGRLDEDVWLMGQNTSNHHKETNNLQPSWFRLQTNYDHWEEPPVWDDRRHPGIKYVEAIGQEGLNAQSIYTQSLSKFPTFNPHTDVTGIMSPTTGEYMSVIWRGDDELQGSPAAIFI